MGGMSKAVMGLLAVGGLIALLVMGGCSTYNSLVGKQQAADAAWAQVANQYQRRADLIPNLVATVKGASEAERETLRMVVEARASVGRVQINANEAPSPETLQQFEAAQSQFSSALSRLLVVAERYPELKSIVGFQQFQVQLEGTENRIAVERGRFNEVVMDYNTAIKRAPAVFFAGLLGFQPKGYFQAQAGADQAPTVDFGSPGAATAPAPAPAPAPVTAPAALPTGTEVSPAAAPAASATVVPVSPEAEAAPTAARGSAWPALAWVG